MQDLTIIVIFYNNVREARRTLFTLSRTYQNNIDNLNYKVLAVDSNSTEKLSQEYVAEFGKEFEYHFYPSKYPSPVEAMNFALTLVKSKHLCIMIDGAHMLTPNVLSKWWEIIKIHPNYFVYTQRYHLGKYKQNDNVMLGYNQQKEDELLKSVDWKNDGYYLFLISDFKQSNEWWFRPVFESNCFFIKTIDLERYGNFNKGFKSAGGGFVNLDVFKKAVDDATTTNIVLLGESTFHQYHDGTTTNVERKEMPLELYRKEYFEIYNNNYVPNIHYEVLQYGVLHKHIKIYIPNRESNFYLNVAKNFKEEGEIEKAIDILEEGTKKFPFNFELRSILFYFNLNQKNYERARIVLDEAFKLDATSPRLLLLDLFYNKSLNNFKKACEIADQILKKEPANLQVYLFLFNHYHYRVKDFKKLEYYEQLLEKNSDALFNTRFSNWIINHFVNRKNNEFALKILKKCKKINNQKLNFELLCAEIKLETDSLNLKELITKCKSYITNYQVNLKDKIFFLNLLKSKLLSEECLKYCEELIIEEGSNFELNVISAECLIKINNFEKAKIKLELLNTLAAKDEENAEINYLYSYFSFLNGSYQKSLGFIETAISFNKGNAKYAHFKKKILSVVDMCYLDFFNNDKLKQKESVKSLDIECLVQNKCAYDSLEFDSFTEQLPKDETRRSANRIEYFIDFQKSVLRDGNIEIHCPFTKNKIKAKANAYFPPYQFFYKFESNQDFYLIIADRWSEIAGYFFPEQKLIVLFKQVGLDKEALKKNCLKILEDQVQFKRFDKKVLLIFSPQFGHQFWNELPALFEIITKNKIDRLDEVWMYNNSFIDLELIFPMLSKKIKVINGAENLNQKMKEESLLFIPFKSHLIKKDYAAYTNAQLDNFFKTKNFPLISVTKNKNPNIWLSVRLNSRTVENQVEVLQILINKFIEKYAANIFIDGYSLQPNPTKEQLAAVEEEKQLVKEIMSSVKQTEKVHSLIGKKFAYVCFLANKMDYYICHQGSLQHKIAWLNKINGFVHCNNKILELPLNERMGCWESEIAKKPTYVEAKYVEDVKKEVYIHGNWSNWRMHQNYILDAEKVVDQIMIDFEDCSTRTID